MRACVTVSANLSAPTAPGAYYPSHKHQKLPRMQTPSERSAEHFLSSHSPLSCLLHLHPGIPLVAPSALALRAEGSEFTVGGPLLPTPRTDGPAALLRGYPVRVPALPTNCPCIPRYVQARHLRTLPAQHPRPPTAQTPHRLLSTPAFRRRPGITGTRTVLLIHYGAGCVTLYYGGRRQRTREEGYSCDQGLLVWAYFSETRGMHLPSPDPFRRISFFFRNATDPEGPQKVHPLPNAFQTIQIWLAIEY